MTERARSTSEARRRGVRTVPPLRLGREPSAEDAREARLRESSPHLASTALARLRAPVLRIATLRMRLTVAVALLAGAGLTAGGALLVHAVEATVVRAIEDQSRDELRVIGGQLAGGVPLDAVHAAPGRRLSFVRADGTRIETQARSQDGAPPPPWPLPERPVTPLDPPPVPVLTRPGAPAGWSVVEMPLSSPRYGTLHAVAQRPLDDVLRSTQTLQRILALGIPALVVMLTVAAWLLVGRALRPVRVMTQTAAGIADATASDRLVVPASRDELAELADTLNHMLDRLAEGARRQREFVSDASHELRSPVAATRAQIEVALAHPERAAPAAVLAGVLAETTRLESLVADLLALARLDERGLVPSEEIDLDDVVLEEAARTRGVAVDTTEVAAVKVCGERKCLAQLVRNLLDNAARHAASQIAISTCLVDGTALLVIDDDGPGIPEPDRARVFDRFTRLSASRSRDDGGTGLGLALVRRIAEHHLGSVRADRSPPGGARFEVRLPALEHDVSSRVHGPC